MGTSVSDERRGSAAKRRLNRPVPYDGTDFPGLRTAHLGDAIFESLRYESPISLSSGGQVFGGDCFIGAFSYLQHQCDITNTSIGRYCSLASWICSCPGQHNPQALSTHPFVCDPEGNMAGLGRFESYRRIHGTRPFSMSDETRRKLVAPKTQVGHNVWVGMRAIIMGGVTVGHGAVIAAGAVVTKDVPPYAIVAGVPARVVKMRFEPSAIRRLLDLNWWDYDLAPVKDQVDFGQVEQVLDFMEPRIESGELPAFSSQIYRAKRNGSSYHIEAVPSPALAEINQ